MSDRPTKVQRWLDLVAFLLSRRMPVSIEAIRENVPAYAAPGSADEESIRRKFERDKKELRDLGIPIETLGESYRLSRRNLEMPVLRVTEPNAGVEGGETPDLDAEDLRELAEALRLVAELPAFPFPDEADTALRKLAFDHPSVLEESRVRRVVAGPESAAGRRILEVLAEAVLQRARIELRYRSMGRDAETARTLEPYGIFLQHGQWYLIARDVAADSRRVFRADRIRDLRVAPGQPPHFEVPEGFDLRSHAIRAPWELGDGVVTPVHVRFDAGAAARAERAGWGSPVDGEGRIRRFEVRRSNAFLRWVLSFAGEAEIVSPAGYVEDLQTLALRTADLYRTGRGA